MIPGLDCHEKSCASHRVLLSDPIQLTPCDCLLERMGPEAAAARDALRADQMQLQAPPAARPKVIAFPGCGPVENPGGSPPATAPTAPAPLTIPQALRTLADLIEKDGVELKSMICIPTDEVGTDAPYLLGPPMKTAEVIGRLEISKQGILMGCWDPDA